MNLVKLVNFVKYGGISLKITDYDIHVKYKVSYSEVLLKIVEIMITIDLHVFSPVFTKCVLT